MRKLIAAAGLLAVALIPTALEAQRRPAARRAPAPAAGPSFGAELDWGSDTDVGIGARVVFPLRIAPRTPLDGTISFDYYFPSAGDFWELNGNVAYRFRVRRSSLGPYAGGGLNIGHVSGGGASDTRLGLNLLTGTTFKLTGSTLLPFAEFRGVIGDFDQVVLSGGVRFSLK